jgi:hypothetical protein
MSKPQGSSDNERLHRFDEPKRKAQAEYAPAIGADQMTVEERESEREAISRAIPGGVERVANEQRLPAEGIGAAGGALRRAADEAAGIKHEEPGEHAGDPSQDAVVSSCGTTESLLS